jgi:predicted acylesterase/phospholipase RssA
MRKLTIFLAIFNVAIVCLGGYVAWRVLRSPRRLPAVPMEMATRAVIPGIPGARYWVGVDIEAFVKDVLAARQREVDDLAKNGHTGALPPADLLAVSGGGDNGAFGAGLLCAWSAAGNRPVFKAVTGVSTGALIAPFAYLGPEYDDVLRQVYTSVKPTDIAERRDFLAAIDNDAVADNRPLWDLISKFIDAKFLEKIAAEHAKGRLLLVGTTNLDARQPIIWNLGAIASSGAPNALDLFRKILLASAAIPGAFPPSMFQVEVDGRQYEEMHVDGGASAQVFMYPPSTKSVAASMGIDMSHPRELHLYIIRNAELKATWQPVQRRTINIAGRAIASLIHTQGIGDLYRIYVTAQRDGLDYNLAYIGPDFNYQGVKTEEFDTAYMQALFKYGYDLTKGGYPWKKLPPGLDVPLGGRTGS